jgi:hypothetical protein
MHPFWSSHKEKQLCVRLSMEGSHDQSWSSMGGTMGSSPERKGRGKEDERGGVA